MPTFLESDALVLCAIAMSSLDRVATLRDLIGATDHLNAGCATLDEINGAVWRLASVDLIDCQAHALSTGNEARNLLKNNHHLPARSIVPLFQAFLETKSLGQHRDESVFFSEDEYQTACAQYHRDMKAAPRNVLKNG
jgi:hypothetical protein